MFEFNINSDKDERSIFANNVCKILVEKHKGDLMAAVAELKQIYDGFFDHVRNIYELVYEEIALFALYELMLSGKDRWGFSDEEYQAALSRTLKACIDFYC